VLARRTPKRGCETTWRAPIIGGVSEYLSALSNAGLCEHLEKLEASDRAMARRSERLRRELNDLEGSEGPGAGAADALREEEREISERRSLLQEQIGELHVERDQRLTALRTRRKAA
jgi:Zn-dependent oligopeptidase